ncbi:MAG: TolC family protein [Bacteroidales bacterium]|nr:TolC family protein [Bacteroidales bacterium]
MYLRNLKPLVFLLALFPLGIIAQNNSMNLSLQQAIELGIKQNLMRQVSQLEVEKKQAKVNEYMANLFPTIKASGNYNRNIDRPVIFMPAGPPFFGSVLKMGSENSYTGGVSFGLPLFNMAIYESIALGKKDLEITKEKLRENEIQLTTNIKKTYYNLLLLDESYKVMNKSYKHALDNVQNITQMNQQGMVSDYDKIRAKVQVENLKPNLVQLQKSYDNVMRLFKLLLNIDDSIQVTIDTTLILDNNIVETINKEIQFDNNTTLRQLALQKDLLKSQLRLTQSGFYPTLTAIGNYQYQSQADNFKFNDYKWVKTSILGLQLNIPIFAGLVVHRQIKQVKITTKELELQEEFTRKNIESQIETAISNMQVAQEKLSWAQQNMLLAEQGYNIAKTRYNTGQSTLLELNDADNALTQAQLNHIQAKFEYLNAKFDLEQLINNNK